MKHDPAADPRTRMVRSAADLQRTSGVTATGFSDIIAHSGAPRGSIYYHFPEGRVQLAVEATTYAAEAMADELRSILAAADPHEALDAFVAMWLNMMREDDFHVGCAVAAAAVESRAAPALRRAAADGFALWRSVLSEAFVRYGLSSARAESLALSVLAAVEGAIILARAEGGGGPLLQVRETLHRLIDLEAAG